ncbi:MAG: DUF4011 domain-containing protein, partial [Candidatus Eremiobacterota bacterium]
MMVLCSHCRLENPVEEAYCDGCGQLLQTTTVEPAAVVEEMATDVCHETASIAPDIAESTVTKPESTLQLPETPAPDSPPVLLTLDYDRCLNFAMQQNAVPTIKRLSVTNLGTEPLEGLEVRLRLEPDLSHTWSETLDILPAEATLHCEEVYPAPIPTRLVNTLERERGTVRVELLQRGHAILSRTWDLDVLAYNEWNGGGSLPELLAAFVMPNHPAIGELLQSAARFLGEWTGDPSLDGYQSKSRDRVRKIAAAIYAAVQERGIGYVSPPASFEKQGQKIRTPDQIVDGRLGTCLDLTTLLAAALEQAGLHAILVVIQGHAFPGVWLLEHHSPQTFTEDASELSNRLQLGEIGLFDSSAAAQKVPFEAAEQTARGNLGRDLVFALDLKACRLRRFCPLPMRQRDGYVALVPESSEFVPAAPADTLPALPTTSEERRSLEPAAARLERWKDRLLDLTLRNRLLNYKDSKKSLPLLGPAAEIENHLYRTRSSGLGLLNRPDRRDPRSTALLQTEHPELPDLAEELKRGRVYVDLTANELDKRVLEIYRAARTTLEETGANTLYVAVGFLKWFEAPSSDRELRAPLLLYPAELVRGTAREPFRLRLADEEPRVNSTLLRKLTSDFNLQVAGLEELPEDDDGLDVNAILQRFRQAVVGMPRWEVVPTVHVSMFSFAKYLMWLDLEQRREQLMESPPVRQLVMRQGDLQPLNEYLELDEARPASESLCVVDSDSSQLEAIYTAEDGSSFVLEGPPGTGKSQTITNLIAQMLGAGRSVLFVSEKQCALNVVHQRLEQVGLGPFCLELHSNHTSKQAVLQQLRQACDAAGHRSPQDWTIKAGQLQDVRTQLNAYAEVMHRPRPLGRSVYQVTGELCGLGEGPRADLRSLGDLSGLDRARFLDWERLVEGLAEAGRIVGQVPDHPCQGVEATDWSQDWQDSFLQRVEAARQAWEEASRSLDQLRSELGMGERAWSFDDLAHSRHMCEHMLSTPGETRGMLTAVGWKQRRQEAEQWIAWARRREEVWSELQPHYSEAVLGMQLSLLQPRFERAASSNSLVAFFRHWNDRGQLKPTVLGGKLRSYAEVAEDLRKAQQVVGLDRQLQEVQAAATSFFGSAWQGWKSSREDLLRRLDWAEKTRDHAVWLEERSGSVQKLTELSELGSDLEGRSAGRTLNLASGALKLLGEQLDQLANLGRVNRDQAWRDPAGMADSLFRWQQHRNKLRDWNLYLRARARVVEAGLGPLVELHSVGRVATEDLGSAFRRSVLSRWLDQITAQEPVLRDFHGQQHDGRVRQFQDLDQTMLTLARQEVMARLAGRIPSLSNAPNNSEAGVLNNEFLKQRRHLPVRKLFQRAPRLVRQLKPCFLMSPLSVAQYLDPALPAFDLVVFDEASQIPVWDGIGALARGRQSVVVGDSKQLPPTAFFSRGDGDAEPVVDEDYEDLESILNECVVAGFPSRYLLWHYRSRHEDLILFSNHHYYDSKLYTFPAPLVESSRFGVSWRHVPGHYDRGGSRTNKFEAEAVVAEVVRRLKDPEENHRSIGVVTFSQTQQSLVEDLLDKARRENPDIEGYFGPPAREPVFIKNLENVQGDERDVILFSIGYGPDQTGKVLMNFGPLNRDGGERRLNVAVSRARQQVVVFSTLLPEQIDLSRVAARGVRDLKTYLEFAARGRKALAEATHLRADAGYESMFEEQVARALQARGWTVHPQVGCSGYRIDLGVVDPEFPGRYLLGVECDGASYHSARSARDRDRLREGVLRGLGWELVRVWSTDWWLEPGRQVERIEQALQEALRRPRGVPEVAPPPPAPIVDVEEPQPLIASASASSESFEAVSRAPLPAVTARHPIDHAASRAEVLVLVEAVLGEQAPVSVREATRQVIQP